MEPNKPFAEIIESSLQRWMCQSWEWDTFPHFGSLVAIPDKKRVLLGIVHQVQTGSMDPARYPFPYQKTEEELRREQPQIFEFLKTTFSCITIGYQEKGTLYYQLTPEPPRIHAFAELPTSDLVKQVLFKHRYLPLLCSASSEVFNMDESLLAILRHQHELKTLSHESLRNFIDSYTLLMGNEYRRIKLLMRRIQYLME